MWDEGTKKTTVQAGSMEELIQKIKEIDWDSVQVSGMDGRSALMVIIGLPQDLRCRRIYGSVKQVVSLGKMTPFW